MSKPSVPEKHRPLGPGTLGRRLVARVTILVTLMVIALSSVMLAATRQISESELDLKLQTALSRGGRAGNISNDPEGSGLVRIEQTLIPGIYSVQAPEDDLKGATEEESKAARKASREEILSIVIPEMDYTQDCADDTQDCSDDQLDNLEAGQDKLDGVPENIELPDLGNYRFMADHRAGGLLTVVGLPYSIVTEPLRRQALFTLLFAVTAILTTFVGMRWIVTRALRPLNRLADTATEVSKLQLATGSGEVPVRVADVDTDERSEVGRVGVAFNHMLNNVENALVARNRSEMKVRQFVADASHELRNPLAAIRGYSELTRRNREALPADTAHALGRMEGEADRMSFLVEDLLLLARLDSRPELDIRPVDITQIVLNAVADAQIAGAEHHWSLDLPPTEIIAPADPNRLHQVIANLLGNARKHTPPGTSVTTRLRLEAPASSESVALENANSGATADASAAASSQVEDSQTPDMTPRGNVVIEVIDDGPGVPAQIKDNVFERFTRADTSRVRQEGSSSTGLGLAIVAAVSAAHGGSVTLESEPGNTCFTLRFPA